MGITRLLLIITILLWLSVVNLRGKRLGMGKAKAGKFLFIISHSLSFDFTLIKSFQKVLIMNILCVNTLVFTMATNYLANNNDGKGLSNLDF